MIKKWEIVDSRIEKDYKVFKLRIDRAVSPRTGQAADFLAIESHSWVNVIALTADREVVMIRQYRHGSRQVSFEIPGGLVEETDAGNAAIRELREETGYAGENAILLGSVNPNPAIFSNLCHTYLVENVRKTHELSLDENEDIETETIPISRIPALISQGVIDHALVIAAFHFYFQKFKAPAR
jgi:ADP-ribose pyrophosphatase